MSRALVPSQRSDTGVEEYESIVAELSVRYDAANGDFQKSRQSLYHFLAWVYVSAPKIDAAHGMKGLLVTEVEKLVADTRDCKRRPKYHDRATLDLLLMLKTRIDPELASSKCGWLAALKAAQSLKPEPVPADEQVFIEWISGPGRGVDGARKGGGGPQNPFNLALLVDEQPLLEHQFTIDLAEDIDVPDDFIVILAQVVSRHRNKATVVRTEVFTGEKRVRQLGRSAYALRKVSDQACLTEVNQENREILKAFKASDQADSGALGMITIEDVPSQFKTQWRHDQRYGDGSSPPRPD